MKPIIRLATTAVFAAAPVAAQEVIELSTITLTANHEATEIDRSGSSVSVLEGEDLQDRVGQPLAETIARLPGVSRRQSGPLGTEGSLQLRGAPQQYLPVVLDGIDMSDPALVQPYFDIGGLTGAGIGRVELLRGAQSALYGSRAVAGVLSLESPRPTREGVEHRLSAMGGSYNSVQAAYDALIRNGGTDLTFSASHVRTDGFSARDENDGNFEADGFESTRLGFYAAHELQDGATIGLNGFWEDSAGDFDDAGDVAGTPFGGTPGNDYFTRRVTGLRGFAKFQTGTIDHEVALTGFQNKRTSTYDGFTTPFDGKRTKLSWQGAADLGASGSRVIFGADTEKESAEGNGDARLSGLFTELSTPVGDRVDVTTSLRHDRHSRFGGFTAGRIAAVYRADDDLLFRAAIGNGFRAPSLYELFSIYGDPTLQREESLTAEAGVEKRWGADSHIRATAFWMEAENLIGWDDRGTEDFADDGYAQVDGTAIRKGLELDGRAGFGDYALTAAYTYTDNGTDSQWAKVPVHSLNLGLEAQFVTGTKAQINLRHIADRPSDLKDFTTADLAISHPFSENTEGFLLIENIFDEEYQQVAGYGTSDRAIYAGVRASF